MKNEKEKCKDQKTKKIEGFIREEEQHRTSLCFPLFYAKKGWFNLYSKQEPTPASLGSFLFLSVYI